MATKEAASFAEPSRGVAAVTHEPAIDPTVRLYLFESFNLNKMFSNCSTSNISPLKLETAASFQQKYQDLKLLSSLFTLVCV